MADDSEAVIREIELLMADDFEIVGKAANGLALVEQAMRLRPDLIVTDFEMPGMDGLQASRETLKINPRQPIVLLTAHPDPHLAQEALEAGISGYVLKFSAADELIPAAQGALRGETFISPGVDLPVY
ncbi:MAG TPA: response regulator transcription factor [Bryobacteraceae bacterium]|nr:response regulator transcription factor [Bryobacteraceae bacterium]